MVMMFALMAAFVIPNLGAVRARALERQAEEIAAQLEFARQRAIVTGIPHRVVFDFDAQAYRVEWQGVPEEKEPAPAAAPATTELAGVDELAGIPGLEGLAGLVAAAGADAGAGASQTPLDLSAPREEEREFRAVPGPSGRELALDDDLAFVGAETSGGRIEEGEATVDFESDGTTEYTRVSVDDETGRAVTLEVLPLADTVRILDEPL